MGLGVWKFEANSPRRIVIKPWIIAWAHVSLPRDTCGTNGPNGNMAVSQ